MSVASNEDRLIVVSADSHVGPRLVEDLGKYCPPQYESEYRAFIDATSDAMDKQIDALGDVDSQGNEAAVATRREMIWNRQTAGHYDAQERLREMDWEGIAAEIIFHGSQNEEPFPFLGLREWNIGSGQNRELLTVGYRMYNEWLGDFVSSAPQRLIGLAYIPMWDVDKAVAEATFAATLDLGGINLPAPRAGLAAEYDDPVWEPLWTVCEEHGLMLTTHAGVPFHPMSGPQQGALRILEVSGWPARRGMHRLIFGGVFERHPELNLILTEQARGWWSPAMEELDMAYGRPTPRLIAQVPKKPSEYMRSNVFIGASFMPPVEAKHAVDGGYAQNVIWGRDYPHGEGTYRYPDAADSTSMSKDYMRWAFADCPVDATRQMLGETGIRAYRLDRDFLQSIAARIGPTTAEVHTPMVDLPPGWKADAMSG